MPSKYKFTKEYDFKASAKMLYPYFTNSQQLEEWFVDKVWIDNDKVYHFEWQGEPLRALLKMHKVNSYVKYEFFPKPGDDSGIPNYVEFKMTLDELTGLTYLKITDFSEMDDEIELNEMWDNFIKTLKEKTGG
ncbi:MAG: START-like domain-containing protein [Bacteroidota bacterium]|nr:START-like domain-containing protein [Bacteroidota bacterium]